MSEILEREGYNELKLLILFDIKHLNLFFISNVFLLIISHIILSKLKFIKKIY